MPQSNSLSANKFRALVSIDSAAAQARLVKLSHGFGQDLVYQTKLDQAKRYLATPVLNILTPVPAYVAADASAWSVSAQVAAQAIVDAAAMFHEVSGPNIEMARLSGKIAVRAAASLEDVAAALATATAAISALS